MSKIFLTGVFLCVACSSGEHEVALNGPWTWPGATCASDRLEIGNDAITAVLSGESRKVYLVDGVERVPNTSDQFVMDLRVLPQKGLPAESLRYLKETEGAHSMTVRVDDDRMEPLLISIGANYQRLGPDSYAYKEFSLQRCPSSALS
ncbi:MAG: hypothetical protein QOJ91_283 [Sphingomonadales bacterium]|jgi:hypothetical protein|nr:hypothetical protein [Sphingomonadales bacterium]